MRIAVTGAQGFVGTVACRWLGAKGHEVDAIGRLDSGRVMQLTDLDAWTRRLKGVDAVVHLAARAHVLAENEADPLTAFRKVNVDGTRCVATAAAQCGVRRFVFTSSIGVLGTDSGNGYFSETSVPCPVEPYAISKWEAEQVLREIEGRTSMEVAVVRPALTYGPGVKGNFRRLAGLIQSGLPLPLGSIRNTRSFIGVENLCSLLELCATHPDAAGALLVAADGDDVSTPQLLRLMATAMRCRLKLVPVPVSLLSLAMRLSGKGAEFERLSGNLRIDAQLARKRLNWRPHKSLPVGLTEMVGELQGSK